MFNLFVEILTTISLLACFASVRSASSGNSKSGKVKGCSTVLTAPSGNILSPNYGPRQTYPGNLACTWTIKAPVGKKIKLSFKDFVVEKSPSCRADYLLLYDGENDSARLVGRYCSARPAPFTSSSNYIHMGFYSDVSLGYRGFFATYNISFPTTEKPTTWKSSPKFKSTVLNVTVIAGDPVILQCEVDGTPEPVITWRKDSRILSSDKNVIITKRRFKSLLTITKVNKSDQGRYSCKASNGFGPPIEARGSLVIEDRKIPLITKMTKNQTVSVGEKIKLHCEAKGLAPMTISFREKNKELKRRKCDQNVGCQIKHTKMFVEDTVITCKVLNAAGDTTRDIYINVKGPPVIIRAPKNQTVQRGDAVNFTCVAVGKNLIFRWLKDNIHIPDGIVTREGRSVLKLSVKQNATLTCSVEGQDGKTSKNATVSIIQKKNEHMKRINLTFFEVPENKKINYNDSASVRCRATGYPLFHLSWKLNDTNVTTTTKTKRLSADGVSTLKLQSLKKSVTVVCIAKNKFETIKSPSATITVNKESATEILGQKKSEKMNDNIKLILGAGGGVLVLTGFIILFIVLRRKRNKKIEKAKQRETSAAREDENLIPNPIFSNNGKEAADTKPGVETLHYPRDSIEHTETLENGSHIEMFLGRAADLPFSPGEFDVVVRALKNTDPPEEVKDEFDLEASLLANLVHPNVVRLMAVCIKTPPLCLLFEYSNYGYLDEYLQDCDQSDLNHTGKTKAPVVRDSFTELANVDRLSIAKQIVSGMKYLTDKGYVHQELRARNCLVFKDLQVKVANLGLHWAKPDQNFFVMEPEEKQRFPVRWLPPEVVLYGEYTHSADVWSYGVLLWEIFSNGHIPYTGINDSDVVSYVRCGNVLPRPKVCPHEVYEVMKTCWEIAPLERPDFKSLQDTMTALHAGVPV